MATAGDLVVNLGLNSKPFATGITKAKGSMGDFAASATTLLNPVTAIFAGMAAAAAATGLSLYGIGQRIETLAAIADKAKQTGLSGEFIQELGFAADQSGVHVEGLLGGLEKMTIQLGKAQLNTEETATAFAQIGLEATALADLSPEDQFLAIADAIAKLPTVSEKAAASVAIFGKSASEMAPLLGEGEKGIRALMAEAKNLKISISEEDLKSIAAADDAMARMKSSLSSVISNVAVGMAPLFESMSNTITEITPKIAEIARAMSTGLADAIQKGVAIFNEELLPSLKEFLTVTGDVLTKWSGMENKFEFVGEVLKAVFDVATEYIKLYWSIMLDDMISDTADAALEMLKMLDPRQGAAAVADWLLGQNAEKIDPNDESAALDAAQARLGALMDRLNGKTPAATGAAPGVGNAAGGVPGTFPLKPGSAMGTSPVKPPGKDPNVDATQQQTKLLLEGLKAIRPPEFGVVPAF